MNEQVRSQSSRAEQQNLDNCVERTAEQRGNKMYSRVKSAEGHAGTGR